MGFEAIAAVIFSLLFLAGYGWVVWASRNKVKITHIKARGKKATPRSK